MRALPVAFFGGAPGGVELLIVFAAFLMLFGARRVPEMARSMGRLLEQLRRSARDLSDDLLHADLDEAPSARFPPRPAPTGSAESDEGSTGPPEGRRDPPHGPEEDCHASR
jgi:sec-independent protein translocase protein TatA